MATINEKRGSSRTDASTFDAGTRERLLAGHPIKEGEYTLPTQMMQRTYALVRELVWARRTGTVFYSSPRMGKTRCAGAIRDLLREEFPNIYVTLLSTRPSGRPTTSHMLRLILEAESHVLSKRPDPNLLFGNAVADIRVKAGRIGAKQYVLLIDEMQLLNDSDLQQLVCFHNQLELQNLKMTVISFAQLEILHRRTSLLASNARQIIGRFLSDTLQFDGCCNEADFGDLLRCYDLASEYPEGSGITYTQFFFPIAFRAGFRLENYSTALWDALHRAAGSIADQGVPMEHICLTINDLLLSLRKQDHTSFFIDGEDIDIAVAASKLQSFSDVLN
ncbi:AAA family ATPase [Massilia timonae]|uniref:AAA family ATPase n=1 Tax=Massilia timonae TaxID=47229 RepID=UPI0028D6EDC4|nr:AAA family ATPase [Massilia timonae]